MMTGYKVYLEIPKLELPVDEIDRIIERAFDKRGIVVEAMTEVH